MSIGKIINKNYKSKRENFNSYINKIKKSLKPDFYIVSNSTIITDPYISIFPKMFFSEEFREKTTIVSFIKNSFKFYFKHIYLLISYFIAFLLFKIFYTKKGIDLKNITLIDVYILSHNVIKDGNFYERYFPNLYNLLDKYNYKYAILPRIVGTNKNPFKLIKFFKIINQDKRNFVFEFEYLSIFDFLIMLKMILLYPFKTLTLMQKNSNKIDNLFNYSLIEDLSNSSSEMFQRYILGKNLANRGISKIYSWGEFQVVERVLNYSLRSRDNSVKIVACQFFIPYENYFSFLINDIDYDILTSPHEVLVNGTYFLLNREKIKYKKGVSLRYDEVFKECQTLSYKEIVLLGTFYDQTKNMLEFLNDFDKVLFRNHPMVEINKFGKLPKNIYLTNDSVSKLICISSIIICTSSTTAIEAVSRAKQVIIIAHQSNFTLNPLVEYGKGKIWDIAFSKDDVKIVYDKLISYRKNHPEEIKYIAKWYKDNFFIEPTEENIIKAFELKEKK